MDVGCWAKSMHFFRSKERKQRRSLSNALPWQDIGPMFLWPKLQHTLVAGQNLALVAMVWICAIFTIITSTSYTQYNNNNYYATRFCPTVSLQHSELPPSHGPGCPHIPTLRFLQKRIVADRRFFLWQLWQLTSCNRCKLLRFCFHSDFEATLVLKCPKDIIDIANLSLAFEWSGFHDLSSHSQNEECFLWEERHIYQLMAFRFFCKQLDA